MSSSPSDRPLPAHPMYRHPDNATLSEARMKGATAAALVIDVVNPLLAVSHQFPHDQPGRTKIFSSSNQSQPRLYLSQMREAKSFGTNEPSFRGNLWCTGVGGGDVPPAWKDISQSVSCHAGAQTYIYADHYNDLGGALITHNVEDLTGQLYDNNSKSFSKNLKAIWIFKP